MPLPFNLGLSAILIGESPVEILASGDVDKSITCPYITAKCEKKTNFIKGGGGF
jgi:hypothetical protein